MDDQDKKQLQEGLKHLAILIDNSQAYLELTEMPAWDKLIKDLRGTVDNALQEMLSAKTDSERLSTQSYAQALNFVVNWMDSIKATEDTAIKVNILQEQELSEELSGAGDESKKPSASYTGGDI